jgi:hypothetical protein
VRGARDRPAVTSDSPLLPRPTGERGRAAMQAACNRAKWARFSDSQHAQHGGPGPRVMQPACRMLRACNCTATCATTTPPRLRNQYRDSRRPSARPSSASLARRSMQPKNGSAVMALAGGQEQRSRRQPSLRPIWGQRENPLSGREDNAPVFRSSNGSRTRNDRPANHSPRRINSAAGQAAPLAGEAGDASPSP